MKKNYFITFLNKKGVRAKSIDYYGTYDGARETAYLELHNSILNVVVAKIYQNGRCIKKFHRVMEEFPRIF